MLLTAIQTAAKWHSGASELATVVRKHRRNPPALAGAFAGCVPAGRPGVPNDSTMPRAIRAGLSKSSMPHGFPNGAFACKPSGMPSTISTLIKKQN
ncbi:MAG: hypothetical protein ACSHXI_02340 [Hoeflea sp.]|uniref:hypothetical protein n=1 Tax=Hoeflea sp. TaxID=1940281 RepID=UPI003EF9146F